MEEPGRQNHHPTLTRASTAGRDGVDFGQFGARPLARVIQEHIKKPLADELLFGRLAKGGIVRVTRKPEEDGLAFSFEERPVVPAPSEPELVQ